MEERGSGLGGALFGLLLVLLLIAAIAWGGATILGTPESRARAESERIHAEAYSYSIRQQANIEAAAERAAIREAAREAGHERAIETLPYLLVVGGAVVLGGFAAFIVWDLRSQRTQGTDPVTLYYLSRMEIEQRRIWRHLAELNRHGLVIHEPDELAIYTEED